MGKIAKEQLLAFSDEIQKLAKVVTPLKSHQQRVVDRISDKDQPGLVVIHGLGSGKTLTAIAASDALGEETNVVVPASLQENFAKEIKKHTLGKGPKVDLLSLQKLVRDKRTVKSPLMIVDEAHRARDPKTDTFDALKWNEAKKRLLLTGSPFYNHPVDLSPLVNLAADAKVLPFEKDEFTRRYIMEKTVKAPIHQRVANIFRKPENKVLSGHKPVLYERNAPELKRAYEKWVDYHPGNKDSGDYPTVKSQTIKVPMTSQQLKVYDTLMDQAPAWVAYKIKRGLPPSKKESQQLNSFLTAARQAVNSTAPFITEGNPEEVKIDQAFHNLQNTLKKNPDAKAVVYSNFLDAGINPYKKRLDAAGIPYGEFTGEMSKDKRDELVRQYNAGKLKALLLSSAGGEGLDLKGTRLMQILDPHWNKEKLKQVEGRGIRYKSHAHLSPEDRNVLVQHYLATRPDTVSQKVLEKIVGRKPDKSVDEFLTQMSDDKENLIQQFRALLPNKEKKAAKRISTTEESKLIAESRIPRALSLASNVVSPAATLGGMAYGGASAIGLPLRISSQVGLAGALVGGLVGRKIHQFEMKNLIGDGKRIAKDAIKNPARENTLRESARKISLKHLALSLASRSLMPSVVLTRLALENMPPKQLALTAGMTLAPQVIGSLSDTFLDRYRRQIALNELENVRAAEDLKKEEKLQRLRKQVSKLEADVEGDGWKVMTEKRKDWK
jgi:superfamily II DNA or RNA helicase